MIQCYFPQKCHRNVILEQKQTDIYISENCNNWKKGSFMKQNISHQSSSVFSEETFSKQTQCGGRNESFKLKFPQVVTAKIDTLTFRAIQYNINTNQLQ